MEHTKLAYLLPTSVITHSRPHSTYHIITKTEPAVFSHIFDSPVMSSVCCCTLMTYRNLKMVDHLEISNQWYERKYFSMQWQEIKDLFWSPCPHANGPAVNKSISGGPSNTVVIEQQTRPFLCDVPKVSPKRFIIDSDGRSNVKSRSTWCPREIIGNFPISKMKSRWCRKL